MKLPLIAKMGSLQWTKKTGGKLRLIDKFEIARQSFIASRISKKKFVNLDKLESYDLNSISVPDTLAVASVIKLLEEISSAEIILHSYRTYYWGVLLAKANQLSFDSEELLLASLAHDLGLSNQAEVLNSEHCFTVVSSRILNEKLFPLKYPEEKLNTIREAITMHINPIVPINSGVEAHLLNAGAMLDVIGSRKSEISQTVIDEVLRLHPRTNFKQHICQCFNQQSKLYPYSRIALLADNGLNKLIKTAPFSS